MHAIKIRTCLWPLSMAAMLAVPTLAAAQTDCRRHLLPHEARACAAARGGVDELRRFVQRTAKLYQLDVHDYAHAVPRRTDPVRAASVASGARKAS